VALMIARVIQSMLTIPAEFARTALDAAPDAMIFIDAAGKIQFANRQVSVLFGYSHDELVGQNVEMLMPERFRRGHIDHIESYTRNIRFRPMGPGLQLFGQRQDGTEFAVEISLSPIKESDPVLIAAAIRDVTDRKRVEAELMLAREAAEAARELADQARESADRANQGKSRFLATASHDLRQPLQAISLINGALRRITGDADIIEALSQQDQAIGAMSRLLNALLDISKLESGAIKPEPTDFKVAALFEELRTEFSGIAANKGLQLEIDTCQDTAHSDPSLVGQVLRNLVSNAIKYTREGWVRLRCLHEATFIRIEVLDTGIGIPADQLPYICDEFYQVGVPSNASRDGYGLGLSIVQRLVSLLTLKLDVRSEVGRGSTFALLLPASHGQSAMADHDTGRYRTYEPQIGTARVLLVEDDPAVRGATRMLLKVEGYRVTAVGSLAEALQHVREGNGIDLLVTDYHLSDGELGTQVIAALRGSLALPLKTVLMTGDTSTAVAELPRDPYLKVASKPINADELLTLLRALLSA
jgi:PAS domain S-box-containing protein